MSFQRPRRSPRVSRGERPSANFSPYRPKPIIPSVTTARSQPWSPLIVGSIEVPSAPGIAVPAYAASVGARSTVVTGS